MSELTRDIPQLDEDPFSDAMIEDPYAMHERLREAAPVVYLPKYGVYAVTRHADVQAVLGDWNTFISSAGVGLDNFRHQMPIRPRSLLLENDPPEHTAVRTVISRVLSPRTVQRLRSLFETEAESLMDRLLDQREIDGVRDLAEYFPLKVFPDAVGLEAEGRENLLAYGDMLFNALGPRNAIFDRSVARLAPVHSWVMDHCRRESLAPASLGAEIWEAVDTGEITAEQAPILVRSFLSAGVDTTINGIANLLLTLANHPAEYDKLFAEPTLARQTFEEGVRYESIVQTIFRTTSRPATIAGMTIDADCKVLNLLGAANRDPRKWADPARFDVLRKPVGHLAFGSGVHGCVGQVIARMEGELVLKALVRRVKRIELNGTPKRHLNNSLRAVGYLPLRLTPA